jgi:methylmalonyl-CoA mutase
MHEAGATADLELAYTLADGLEYVTAGAKKPGWIDEFAPRISFFWAIGMNHFMEIAKMRAGRMLWAKLMKSSIPKIRNHSPCEPTARPPATASPSRIRSTMWREPVLKRWRPHWAIHSRSTPTHWMKRLPCQPIFRHGLPETRSSFLQEETGITKAIDPWAGSFYVEYLTDQLARKAWEFIEEVEELGGMAKAIERACRKCELKRPLPETGTD